MTFFENKGVDSGRSSGNFLGKADTYFDRTTYIEKNFSAIKVPTITIDELLKELGNIRPDFIKLDVEGAEYLALLGAKGTLEQLRPIMYIEIHSMKNMFKVTKLLTSMRYETDIAYIEPNGVCYLEARPLR